MDIDLREDERFVIEALASKYSGKWIAGDEPPDAYLKIDGETVAVEVSTLTQHIVDGTGEIKPRLSHDSTAIGLLEELNDDLGTHIPAGKTLFIVLSAPLKQKRKLKPLLAAHIIKMLANEGEVDIEIEILSNTLTVKVIPEDRPSGKKIVGTVINQHSSPDILLNARRILDDRIETKTEKCQPLHAKYPVWLALFNDYWLADEETYRQAMEVSSVTHSFEKILLVSGNKSVVSLYSG